VRKGAEIVGVGAIKRERRHYAAKVSMNARFAFPAETLELGYVAVAPDHQGHGLSHLITGALLSQYRGRLFATTYNTRMKSVLETAGFLKRGRQWKGRSYVLSLWERLADAPEQCEQEIQRATMRLLREPRGGDR